MYRDKHVSLRLEQIVLTLLIEGRSNAEIGAEMRWTTQVVKNVLRALYWKYEIFSGDKRIKLVVKTVYARNPHLIPFGGLTSVPVQYSNGY